MSTFAKLPHDILSRTDLTPAAKLVFAMIADRIGGNGEAWPGLRKLATDCGIGLTTATEAIQKLESLGLIVVEHAKGNPGGHTNRYRLGECSESNTSRKANVPESEHRTYRNPNTERSLFGTQPDPYNQTHVTRLIPESPAKRFRISDSDAEKLYQAYPKHVGKAAALKAIAKAIQAVHERGEADPVGWLLGRVQQFAASTAGQSGKFTPHPATWFNAGRFDDDDSAWNPGNSAEQNRSRIAAPVGKYDRFKTIKATPIGKGAGEVG